MKQLRVYLSSTFEDLREYRASVLAKLEQAGLNVAQMESYVAADVRPVDKCLADVAASDIYVGIFAWRYGYEPPADHGNLLGRSITDLEFRQAEASQLRKLIFFAHPTTKASWPDRFVDERTGLGDDGAKLDRLRTEVGTEKLASFFRDPDELASLVLAAIMRSGKSGRVYNIPPRPPGFVPRPNLTAEIVHALTRPGGGASGQSAVIQGPGGFGKTTLAIDAAHRGELIAAFPDGLLWTALGERPDLPKVLSDLYGVITGSSPAVTGTDEIGKALARALGGRRCLLIVDDVWRADDLSPFMNLVGPVLLITTRVRVLAQQTGQTGWPQVPVDEMDDTEAIGLLGRGMELDEGTRRLLEPLANQLGNWPLLLELANARMMEERRSRPGQVPACIAKVTRLFDLKGVFGFDRLDADSRNAAVAKSVDVGLDRAEELELGLAAKAAELSVFAEDLEIPLQALADLWSIEPDLVEEDVLRHLDNLSLVRWDRQLNTVRLHDMVRRAYAARLADAAPVHRRLIYNWGDPFLLPHAFAWQWFAWHCRQGNEEIRLLSLLLDLRWLQARLDAAARVVDGMPIVDVAALLHDFDQAPESTDARRVQRAIRMSAHRLVRNGQALAQQLHGRLGNDAGPTGALAAACRAYLQAVGPWAPGRSVLAPPGASTVELLGHTDGVFCALLLPDGCRALSWSRDRTLRVWNLEGATQPSVFAGHEESVAGALLLPDGRRLLSWSYDRTMRLWDLEGTNEIKTFAGHEKWIEGVLLLPDGRRALSWSNDGTLRLWDLEGTDEPRIFSGRTKFVDGALLMPDGRGALSWSGKVLWLWDLTGGDEPLEFAGHNGTVNGALLLAGGRRVLSWSSDNTLRLWDVEGIKAPRVLAGHEGFVNGALLLPDGRRALSWSNDGTLRVWDLEGTDGPRILAGRANSVVGALLLPDGRCALSWSTDNTLRLWHLDGSTKVRMLGVYEEPIRGALLLPDGQRALTWSYERTLRLWDLNGIDKFRNLAGHEDMVNGALLLPDSRHALSWSADRTLRVWDLVGPEDPVACDGHKNSVIGALILTDSRRALSWSSDASLRVWSLEGTEEPHILKGHENSVSGALLLPDGRRALSWSNDRTLRLWDLDCSVGLLVLAGHENWVNGALMLPDGRRALSWSGDKTLRLWDLVSIDEPRVFAGHQDYVSGALMTDCRRALSWSYDGTLRLWNIDGPDDPYVLAGHDGRVDGALLLLNGRGALSWSSDSTLRLWDLQGSADTQVLAGHSDTVGGALLLPDGWRTLSWSIDGTLRLWNLSRTSRNQTGQ